MSDSLLANKQETKTYTIEFTSPHARIAGEAASKLLKPDSALCQAINLVRQACQEAKMCCDFRPAHIEVLDNHEKRGQHAETLAAQRAAQLQNRKIMLRLEVINQRAVVIPTGSVAGYRDTHITVVYFRNMVSPSQLAQLATIIKHI